MITDVVGAVIMGAGVLFMAFGILGLYKFKNFYLRILITAKIDTVGMFTFIAGLAVRHGLSLFTLKLILLIVIILILNPLTTHVITRAAYQSEYESGA